VNPLALKRALDTLPPTLDETYSRILQSIPDEQRDDAIRLLQLLVYSNMELRVGEAVDAIAVDLSVRPYFDPKNRTPIPSEIILSCSGLVVIERTHVMMDKYWEVIQLTHFSVQQYLRSEKVSPGWKYCMSEDHAMASNAKLCLAYCFSFPQPCYFRGFVGDLPFASTAAEHWAQHAMHFEAQDHQLYEMMQDFLLSDEASIARYQWIHMETVRVNLVPERTWYNEKAEPDEFLPLTIASACGLYKSVESLLLSGANPDEFCPVWGTALCAASHRGHYKIIKLLLNHGARPNIRAGRAELSIAIRSPSSTKRSEIFYALLQHDADVNACDRSLSFPLISAVIRGDEDIIDTLLAQGVEVDAVDYQGKFAISEAAAKGNDTVVRKLLDHRADVNLSDDINGTALVSACRGGHKKVVRTLLKNGALVCQRPEQRLFPKNALEAACDYDNQEIFALLIEHANERESFSECLGLACDLGRTGIVEILLKHKADVNAISRFGNPLLVAFTNGNEQLVQLLIHHGAKINQADTVSYNPSGSLVYRTPLLLAIEVLNNKARTEHLKPMAAIQAARLQTLKTLIAAGADVNVSDDRGQTPLHYAVVSNSSKSPKLIGILTEAGAVLDNVDEQGQTPMIKAVASGAVRCHNSKINIEGRLEILLKAGAKTNVQDVDGRTALHYTAKYGDTKACTMLVEAGLKTNIQDLDGKTALFLAAKYGELAVCEMLIEAGAKTEVQDVNGDTALHWAVWKNHLEICTMLLEAGANVNIRGMRSATALHLAAEDGRLNICATLIEAGAKTDIQDNDGETALHGAVRGSYLELCRMLVEAGANTTIQSASGETALHVAAALDGQLSICKVLIEAGANLDAWNDRGLTPLQVAEEESNSEVVALF
jgi:ankyrin repeat protein